ncbi:response regulator [Aquabacterium sp. CECT 9606]|uniref:ATP-binding response regulator n=1 Tax=Aquabacterium sp. CECT 9606 TaxID=2845822 RepID=UPI001E5D75E9|nr:histidine kinase [Aquabacterium sp. CECT 9606]
MIHLRRGGILAEVLRVESETGLAEALEQEWDLILSDYNLPGYSGLAALDKVRSLGKLVPFILVSGEIGEDIAVQAMRNGANDYLLKSNLARLAPAALLAIEANRTRIAKQYADLALTRSRQQIRELAQHLQTTIEQERAAIAREIHDDVGGALTAVKFDLAWIARHATTPDIAEHAQQAMEAVTMAHEATQRIMHNLRPAILEQGLVAALQWMSDRFAKRTGIATEFRTSHEQMVLSAGVPLVAYRFAQESLTNVSKHALATRVSVDLAQAGGVLSLEVSDNGRGLSPDDLAKAKSFGIRGLHERAETVGGWVDISSGANGTTLILSVPLSGPENGFLDAIAPELSIDTVGTEGDPDDPTAWGTQ